MPQQWVNPDYADVADELLSLAVGGASARGFLIPSGSAEQDEAQPE